MSLQKATPKQFDYDKYAVTVPTQPDLPAKPKKGNLKRLQSEVNNCRMVALINPEGKYPAPSQLRGCASRKRSRISENGESSQQSDSPEQKQVEHQQNYDQWLLAEQGVVPCVIPSHRSKISSAARRRGSAADCQGSQRKIFDLVFEPVMQMINEQLEAQKKNKDYVDDVRYKEFEGDADCKSPGKMTSPEKKVFKDELFERDDQITEKCNTTLNNAKVVIQRTTTTINENKKVMKEYHDAHKDFNDRMEEICEATVRAQAAKYKAVKNYVEPNLSRRFEQKRERARLRALASEQYADIAGLLNQSNTEKMYKTCDGQKLERVNEEDDSKTNQTFQFPNHVMQDGPVSFAQVSANVQLLVTPTPKLSEKSKLTNEDAKRVLGRQLTMQLMPMYRVRQRSAVLKPMTSNKIEQVPVPTSAPQAAALINQRGAIRQPASQPMSASKAHTKRESEPPTCHSVLNMVLPTIQQVAVKNVLKRPKSKGKSANKSHTIGKSALQSSSKENGSNGFRMRKIYIGKVSANGTPSNMARADSAQEPTTHNLLVDRKEMKVQLAPLKKKNKKNRERSTSVKSPRILKGISLNHSAIAGQ